MARQLRPEKVNSFYFSFLSVHLFSGQHNSTFSVCYFVCFSVYKFQSYWLVCVYVCVCMCVYRQNDYTYIGITSRANGWDHEDYFI